MELEVVEGDITGSTSTRSRTRRTTRSGWARASRARSSAPAATRSRRGAGEGPDRRRGRRRDGRRAGSRALGHPRRRDGSGPADERDLVEQTTDGVPRVADELGARSFALPAFGTGVGGLPRRGAARVMVAAARAHEPRALERVVVRGLRGRGEARVRFGPRGLTSRTVWSAVSMRASCRRRAGRSTRTSSSTRLTSSTWREAASRSTSGT